MTAYSADRFSYPAAALDALLRGLGNSYDVIAADVGAGPGVATRLLAGRVAQVIAIEPDARMRAGAERLPNVVWQDGTAEYTALPGKSVDLVAAFQAFHCFDAVDAFREFRRIARRRIGMLQCERNEHHPFSAAYGALIRRYASGGAETARLRAVDTFRTLAGSALREAEVPFTQELTLEGLLGRIDASTDLPREGSNGEELRREACDLFAHFDRRGSVELAMTAYVLAADV